MKKTFAAVVTALALIASPTFAQNAAPVDPAAVAAVREMLASMRYREVMTASLRQMEQGMPQQFRMMVAAEINGDPNLSADDKKMAMEHVEKLIPSMTAAVRDMLSDPALMEELMAETVPLYARTFTVAEIRQLAAFYATPLGQKMLASMPQLMGESMEISNRLLGPRMIKLLQPLRQRSDNQK